MDYGILVSDFMRKIHSLHKAKQWKHFSDQLHGESFVLYFISVRQKEGDVIPGDISNAIGISTARIAATLNRLEEKEFITREIDKDDRRRILVKLTEKGQEYVVAQEKRHTSFLTNMLTRLGENDAKEYVRIMGKLVDIFNNMECVE